MDVAFAEWDVLERVLRTKRCWVSVDGADSVERRIVLLGEERAVMITTSWTGVYRKRNMAVFKVVTFDGFGTPQKMGCFLI